ncbi:DUF6152 family protein [Pontibacter roseus]|uniref:DUF6152 family protein n=1 Tax=Pontibacter roseus TaxID=336989 RepID=UPI0003762374|nr:DUF6152 family protein [Pontibacter roseus]
MLLPVNLSVYLLFPLAMVLSVLHHGWANYDQTKELDYTGQVQEITFENPHGMLQLQHEDEVWTVVLAPPSRMEARGLSKKMVQPNDEVRVVGYPHKDGSQEMRAERIFVGDKKVELR